MFRLFYATAVLALGLLMTLSGHARFMDPSEISPSWRDSYQGRKSDMTEARFNELVKTAEGIYTPIIAGVGGKLAMKGEWTNETPNAFARQLFGNWEVKITGGLARHPELSEDGFLLILCHELGHHLGGFAMGGGPPVGGGGIANEGQADYYATQVCARRLWINQKETNAQYRDKATDEMKSLCAKAWDNTDDLDLCYRVLEASRAVVATMAALKKIPMPQFSTPDQAVVDRTSDSHPHPQCRLDTSLAGALCVAPFNDRFIPGKTARGGQRSEEAEREAASFSCMGYSGYSLGLRPTCWFKPRL